MDLIENNQKAKEIYDAEAKSGTRAIMPNFEELKQTPRRALIQAIADSLVDELRKKGVRKSEPLSIVEHIANIDSQLLLQEAKKKLPEGDSKSAVLAVPIEWMVKKIHQQKKQDAIATRENRLYKPIYNAPRSQLAEAIIQSVEIKKLPDNLDGVLDVIEKSA